MEQQDVLGRVIRDKVTNIEGVCIGTVDWLFGCRQYLARLRCEKKEDAKDFIHKEETIAESCVEIVDPVPAVDAAFPSEEKPKFFGQVCRDKVTGYTGICIARLCTFYAEKQYCLQGRYNKKKMRKPDAIWVDEGRIETVSSKWALTPEEVTTETRGGVLDIALPRI